MDLPEHIILYHILSRTPSKSLSRFKCVSKHWNRMISDPEFMKSRSRRMILLPLLPFQAIDKHEVDNMGADCYSTVKLVDAPFECEELCIVGTFSGIVLLVLNRDRDSFKEHMILYNPLTGAFRKLPDSPLRSRGTIEKYSLFGFGYGTTPDDLKIVALRFKYIPRLSIFCEVFGLRNGSWSTTPAAKLIMDYSTFENYAGTFVNRSLYWLSYNIRTAKQSIVALDLNQMVFSEIEEVPRAGFATLGTLNGSLCVVCCEQNYNGVGIELWIMNKEGDGLAKTRSTFMLSTFDTITWLYDRLTFGIKISILDEGKILRFDRRRNKFVIIDMLKDSHKEVNNITGDLFSQASIFKAIEYVESWISPSHLCSSLI